MADVIVADSPEVGSAVVAPVADTRTEADFRRMAVLICIGIFVTTIATDKQLAQLPLRSFLKDTLGLAPEQMATFLFITGIAWYLKPLAGILSDAVPLFGTRRRSYLLLSTIFGMASWGAMSVVPLTYHTVLVTMTLANVMAMVASTVIGGLLVDAGRRTNATGRLSAMRMVMMNSAALVAGPVGGFIAAREFRLAPIAGVVLMFALGVVSWKLMREERRRHSGREVWSGTVQQLKTIVRSWPLLATVGLTFLHYVAPGFQSLLYYHQKNALRIGDAQIGMIGLVNGLTAVAGALVYGLVCRRFNLRTLLYGGMTLNALSILFYYGYRSLPAAFFIEGAAGFVGMLGLLPLYDLSARATPRGSEALGYSLIMSVGNFAISLSDVSGAYMAKAFHLGFTDMVWINAGTTAAILFFIPLLPHVLVARREGDSAA
jgi:MFS family permease